MGRGSATTAMTTDLSSIPKTTIEPSSETADQPPEKWHDKTEQFGQVHDSVLAGSMSSMSVLPMCLVPLAKPATPWIQTLCTPSSCAILGSTVEGSMPSADL